MLMGGCGRRLGFDKRLLTHADGRSVVAVLARSLVEVFGRLTYLGAGPALPGAPDGTVLADTEAGEGPPGALRAALARSAPGWLAVCALDLPNLTVEDLHTLRREALACREARVVAPCSGGYAHLLAGAWHTDALRFFPTGRPDAVGRLPSLHAWAAAAGVRLFRPRDERAFANVNDPDAARAAGVRRAVDGDGHTPR
jgi:molybdopterin-guanine dinucleotide biosynthesis protein A